MRYGILLLAVGVYLVNASPLSYYGAAEQHQNVPRFLNMTGLEPSKTEALTSSLISISSESLIPSAASLHDSKADGFFSVTSSQIAASSSSTRSISAVATSGVSSSQAEIQVQIQSSLASDTRTSESASSTQSTGVLPPLETSIILSKPSESINSASIPLSTSLGVTLSYLTSISSPVRTSATEVASTSINSKTQSESQSGSETTVVLLATTNSQGTASAAIKINAAGFSDQSLSGSLASSNIDTSAPSSTVASSARPTPPTDQQIVSSSANAIAAAATKSADAFAFSASASSSATGATKSAPAKFPTAENGNLAMANGYNQVFKTLSQTSTCDPKDNSAATACIDGQPATCEVDGTYTLESCPQGESCYAVPQSAGQSGVTVGCYIPSDAAAKLAAGSMSVSGTNSLANVATSTSQSIIIASQNAEATQAIGKASSKAILSAAASQSSQSQLVQPESTSLQLPPPQSVQLVSSSSNSVPSSATAIDEPHYKAASLQIASQTAAPFDGNSRATFVSVGHSQPSISGSADAESASAVLPKTTDHKPASSAAANSAVLVLSFPSDLPSSSAASSTYASLISTSAPAAPAAEQKDLAPVSDSFYSIKPQAGPSATAPPSQTTSPGKESGILANNLPPATPSLPSSATASANAAGITIVPESNSSGEATVTITVTMTIHDRN